MLFERELHLLLGLLTGTTVHTLALSGLPFMGVDGWLALLPQLRSLSVEALEVTVRPGLSSVTQLSHLHLMSEESFSNNTCAIQLPPGCLPASLRSLHLDRAQSSVAGLLVPGQLAPLERLELFTNWALQQVLSGWAGCLCLACSRA